MELSTLQLPRKITKFHKPQEGNIVFQSWLNVRHYTETDLYLISAHQILQSDIGVHNLAFILGIGRVEFLARQDMWMCVK